jgi:hypothetical protein
MKFFKSPIWNRSYDSIKKDLISKQILNILALIHDKQNDENFQDQAIAILESSLEDCADRNIFMIFELNNISNRIPADQLQSLNSQDCFNYFKQQLFYLHILDIAQERVDVLTSNPLSNFNEDLEVYLNYIRVFNNKLGSKLGLNLISISSQRFYNDQQFSPPVSLIDSFDSLVKEYDSGNYHPLSKFLADILVDYIYNKDSFNVDEITKIDFISQFKEIIEDIVLNKISQQGLVPSVSPELEGDQIDLHLEQYQQRQLLNRIKIFQKNKFAEILTDEFVKLKSVCSLTYQSEFLSNQELIDNLRINLSNGIQEIIDKFVAEKNSPAVEISQNPIFNRTISVSGQVSSNPFLSSSLAFASSSQPLTSNISSRQNLSDQTDSSEEVSCGCVPRFLTRLSSLRSGSARRDGNQVEHG